MIRGLVVAFAIGFALGIAAYLAAVEISFRMLGNRDEADVDEPGGGWER